MNKQKLTLTLAFFSLAFFLFSCNPEDTDYYQLSPEVLKDKIKGAWALQTIGVTYGGPTEFRYNKRIIPDSVEIPWSDTTLYHWMTNIPGLYDDVYMDLTFVEVLEKQGLDAPATAFGEAYANASYWLWHANQQGRYNILHGIDPPQSGHWLHNPHADDIDFQIEADFAGIMSPGMPNAAAEICDRVGHVMNSGDGYYGGVYVAAMYSYAFVLDEVGDVVSRALELIPSESTFARCIRDVVEWHGQHPDDWKRTWQLVEEKWGTDIGCPDGAGADFNIDAKINAAYVVMGLLYGAGDLNRTMEVSTRCGQDSDCNPATAAGILGAMMGYQKIPAKWARGLGQVENMDFKYTTISLNEVYEMSYRHALDWIQKHGGQVTDEQVRIRKESPAAVPLEQNFPGYFLAEKRPLDRTISQNDPQIHEWQFEGVGVVLRGGVKNTDFLDSYALESPEQTLDSYVLKTTFSIDGQPPVEVDQPLNFIKRNHELFFKYELPPGKHTLKMEVLNPHEKVQVVLRDLLVYSKN